MENIPGAVARFPSPTGVTIRGRWHNADLSGGFILIECNDAVAAYTHAAQWADLMDLSIVPVLEDAEVGPVLAARFKK
jgi:hypothetical protein